MTTTEIDCPFCASVATIETGPTRTAAATFVCADCSVRVELAPDPVAAPIARAA